MSNNVQNIIKWWNIFCNTDVKIIGITKEFNIGIDKKSLPHLLGLHYINSNKTSLKGIQLYNYIKKEKLTDEEIYSRVMKNNSNFFENVKDRIENFKPFMENLENGHIVEMTNQNTKIKSNYLIVQTEDNKIMQLGIKDIGYEDIFETFIIEKDDLYFKDTTLNEPIISIQKYNENGELVPFSFKEDKNINIEKFTQKDNNKNPEEKKPSLLNRIKEKKNIIENKENKNISNIKKEDREK